MEINEQVKYLADILKEYGLSSVEVETEEMNIKLKKESKASQMNILPVGQMPQGGQIMGSAPVMPSAELPIEVVSAANEPSGKVVKAPLVGTFYVAPGVGKAPYVKVGDTVKKGQIIGIIEAMKLMNEIESDVDGVVEAVLAENGKLVEYGQPLISVR